MNVVAVVQARMASNRLRGKTLMPVAGRPLLLRVIESIRRNNFIDRIVVATSTNEVDDPIEAYSGYLKVECLRGSPLDVLRRYISVSATLKANDCIVRVTADNCICNAEANRRLLAQHVAADVDYTGVAGLSHVAYEFVKAEAFQRIDYKSMHLTDYDREHVTPIFRKSSSFTSQEVEPRDLGLRVELDSRLTVDTPDDLARVEWLFNQIEAGERSTEMEYIYQLLKSHELV